MYDGTHTLKNNAYNMEDSFARIKTYSDHQVLGLFSQTTWKHVFRKAGITMQKTNLNGIYDPYLLNDGEYPLVIFTGQKT